jgi:predicted O-linked N-acetylglucosamine transferase (SPINDLY family)
LTSELSQALALHRAGRLAEAERLYRLLLQRNPRQPDALTLLGTVCLQRGEWAEGVALIDRSLALAPNQPNAWVNRGNAQSALRRFDEALASYDRALALKPDLAEAHNNRGNALRDLHRPEEALASYDRALALDPRYADAHNNRGGALRALNRLAEALESFDRAIALQPAYAEAFNNRGVVLRELGRTEEALRSCERAIVLKPDFADAFKTRGDALRGLGRLPDAIQSYERARALDPVLPYVDGLILHARMILCDWTDLAPAVARVLDGVERGARSALPFQLLAVPSTPAQQRRCAEIAIRHAFPSAAPAPARLPAHTRERIVLGYFSPDFHEHPVANLAAELFELHDRDRFEVIAFSYDASPSDAMRERLRRGFDRFVEVAGKTDREIAALARSLRIDIAVDLAGHTRDARLGIFVHAPAPIRAHFLGYPGTLGAPFVDYLIADPIVIPDAQRRGYAEAIAYLPDTCQPNDRQSRIAERTFARAELALPDDAFVFCCFNRSDKIEPGVFAIWMRLLQRVQRSVLWLHASNAAVPGNLRREAEARGVAGDRLVFAPGMSLPEHLARHRAADLFLDTLHFNAHTTASVALWAGLPVLTCPGETFISRVGASLLHAVGLPELVAGSPAEYEARAWHLATHPDELAAIRHRLAAHRSTFPLFDTPRFARNLESAYERMWQRQRQGLPPQDIRVG